MSDTEVLEPDTRPRSEIHVGEPAGEPLMDAVDLVAGYLPGVNILNGASLTLHEGEIVGIIGPNGAGKSTTMNIITGYLASTEGEVLINGHNILEEPEEAKKCIGYLPELPPVYTDMTVLEYLKFVAELKKNVHIKPIKE